MSAALPPSATVAVIGAGTMGSGIAHVAARAGHSVLLLDSQPGATARALAAIRKDLDALVSRGKLDAAEADAVHGRVTAVDAVGALAPAALVIEAVAEDLAVKTALLGAVEAVVGEDAVIATNTSSLSVTAIARPLRRPGRCVGLHFFNPAPRMALVEVVTGLATEEAVAALGEATMRAWGKTPVRARSTPGFIVNRVARPYYGEALRLMLERAGEPAAIDALLRDCGGFPMGPFELMDLIGIDVNLMVSRSVFEQMGHDRRYAPSVIQQEMVNAGRLGRKTGRGFHDYAEGAVRPAVDLPPAGGAVARVKVVGGLRTAEPLVARLQSAGVSVARTPADASRHVEIGTARLAKTDGRTATRRAADERHADFVLFDLALDYGLTPRLGLARADSCSESVWLGVLGTLQKAGLRLTALNDVAGMAVMRTVAMLANEASDAVVQGVASAADIDTAMKLGTGYPLGPLGWADRLGAEHLAGVLDNLRAHYGEERYRLSPGFARRRITGGRFLG
jgi:3-hydroxybutyryl-CoA dehydrogenase